MSEASERLAALQTEQAELRARLEAVEVLLQDLALRLADSGEAPAPSRAPARLAERYLVTRVAERQLGLPLDQVREVVRMVLLRPLPDAPPAVEGLLDLRGEPLEVVDLRAALGARTRADDLDSRIVVVAGATSGFGLKVDEVLEVEALAAGTVEPPPPRAAAYLSGVYRSSADEGELVLLLDPERLLEQLGREPLDALAPAEPGAREVEA